MKVKKDITFIYMDSAEKAMFMPLYKEAKKRGYSVKMTKNKFERCEIGFYCQHINFPQYSRLSVIMLHDIIQQYGNWPDIWFREPWNKYDIGILPSNQWEENWNKCSQWYYTRPRKGIYKVGWTKADSIYEIQKKSYKEEFYKKYNLDIKKRTILYAPAWENDGKQDDFVKSMLPLDVNILIKQYDFSHKEYPDIARNIDEMFKLHNNIKGVTILPPETNIFKAIAISDILVSEESSTMAEAVMMGVPSVSVSNWLIPDVTPSRYPECNYDFVTMTTREELSNCIKEILDNYEEYKLQAKKSSEKNFSNIGNASTMIMDIIDDYIDGKKIRYDAITPQVKRRVPLLKNIKHKYLCMKREIYNNYCRNNKVVKKIWYLFSKIKNKILQISTNNSE